MNLLIYNFHDDPSELWTVLLDGSDRENTDVLDDIEASGGGDGDINFCVLKGIKEGDWFITEYNDEHIDAYLSESPDALLKKAIQSAKEQWSSGEDYLYFEDFLGSEYSREEFASPEEAGQAAFDNFVNSDADKDSGLGIDLIQFHKEDHRSASDFIKEHER